jgi:hypothetical protein
VASIFLLISCSLTAGLIQKRYERSASLTFVWHVILQIPPVLFSSAFRSIRRPLDLIHSSTFFISCLDTWIFYLYFSFGTSASFASFGFGPGTLIAPLCNYLIHRFCQSSLGSFHRRRSMHFGFYRRSKRLPKPSLVTLCSPCSIHKASFTSCRWKGSFPKGMKPRLA